MYVPCMCRACLCMCLHREGLPTCSGRKREGGRHVNPLVRVHVQHVGVLECLVAVVPAVDEDAAPAGQVEVDRDVPASGGGRITAELELCVPDR